MQPFVIIIFFSVGMSEKAHFKKMGVKFITLKDPKRIKKIENIWLNGSGVLLQILLNVLSYP